MKKRFVVVANPTTQEQDKVFQDWLNTRGLGWWHWLNETWLINDPNGLHEAADIRAKAMECFPGIYNLVLELTPTSDTWAGYGPTKSGKDMFEWIRNFWNR